MKPCGVVIEALYLSYMFTIEPATLTNSKPSDKIIMQYSLTALAGFPTTFSREHYKVRPIPSPNIFWGSICVQTLS